MVSIKTAFSSWCRLAKGGLLLGSKPKVLHGPSDPVLHAWYLPRLPRALGLAGLAAAGRSRVPASACSKMASARLLSERAAFSSRNPSLVSRQLAHAEKMREGG